MSKSRVKGTGGENEYIVKWAARWWPSAERRALMGIRDTGDVAGTPYVVSVKRCESWPIHKWLGDLRKMRANAKGAPGFIAARRNREEWVYIVPADVMADLFDHIYGAPEAAAHE